MNTQSFLQSLAELKIDISLGKNEELNIVAPEGIITRDILNQIKSHKPEIIKFLVALSSAQDYVSIPQASSSSSYPLSYAQRRLWVLSQMEGGSTAYNMTGLYEFTDGFDKAAFVGSIESVVLRHESLRTVFTIENGEPRQKILTLSAIGFRIEEIDLRGVEDLRSHISYYKSREQSEAFDLARGPLFRAKLLQCSNTSYVFLFTMHHIISDGWSMEVLVKDVMIFYRNQTKGLGQSLAALPIQYKDYAVWQQAELKSGKLEEHKQYWLTQLSGDLPVLDLPLDRVRPSIKSYRGSLIKDRYNMELSEGLLSMSSRYGVTLYMLLLSGVKALLHRYTGEKDLIVGSPMAGREHSDLEAQIGFYVNTLVLRTHVKGEESFEELLDKVKQVTLEAYSHQSYPFDLLQEDLSLSRDLSRNPVFDVMVVLQNRQGEKAEKTKGASLAIEEEWTSSKFDLTFNFLEDIDGTIELHLEYNTDIYDSWRMEGLLTHLRHLFTEVIADASQAVKSIEILSKEEASDLGRIGSLGNYPLDKTLVDIFEEVALCHGDRVAIVDGDFSMSYSQLNGMCNQLGSHLWESKGISSNVLVGLLVDRSKDMVLGMLAILKSGGGYLPIDPDYPEERIIYMMEDSGVGIVLTDSDYWLSQTVGNIEFIDIRDKSITSVYPDKNQRIERSPDSLAYIIYTSGSTGKPKGVMVEDGNVLSLLKSESLPFKFNEEDVWSVFHSMCFDFSVWEIYGGLLYGGKVIVVNKDTSRDPDLFTDLLERERVTVLNQTPGSFEHVSREMLRKGYDFNDLRYVIFGGEALKPASLKLFKKGYPMVTLVNMYGITETTVHVTYKEIGEKEIEAGRSNIGRSLDTLSVYMVDEYGNLVPRGISGELVVRGHGVARGYLNRKELTEERFREEGSRVYYSGDLGRVLLNGDIEYLGRKDNQVKIRGHRIEVGEIESVMLGYEGVDQVVVMAKNDPTGNKVLVSYVLSTESDVQEGLRRYIKTKLPDYMVPSYILQMTEMPLTSNGKIDRKRLPETYDIGIEVLDYVASCNEMEEVLAKIWGEVLGRDKVGTRDNFFVTGGDSIKAIRVVAQIKSHLGKDISIKDLYQKQTIEEICKWLKDDEHVPLDILSKEEAEKEVALLKEAILADPKYASLLPADYEDFYPMSDIQKGMIYHSLLDPSNDVYQDLMYYQLKIRNFEFSIFEKAVALLVQKHSILRTSFHTENFAEPIQVVHSSLNIKLDLQFECISSKDIQEQKAYITKIQKEQKKATFEFTQACLWRMRIFDLGHDTYGVFFICHHAIIDGWSDKTLMSELSNIYYLLLKDPSFTPDFLKVSYKDYVIDQLRYKRSVGLRNKWIEELGSFSKTELPLHKTSNTARSVMASTLGEINEELSQELDNYSKRNKVHVKNILLSAFFSFIQSTTNASDVTIGMVSNGRIEQEDGDKVLGCFLNTVPFRLQIANDWDNQKLVKKVDEKSRDLKGLDKFSLQEITSLLDTNRRDGNLIFDTTFSYLDFHILKDVNGNITTADNVYIDGLTDLNTALNFMLKKTFSGYDIIVNYDAQNYTTQEITLLLDYYKNTLTDILRVNYNGIGKALLDSNETERLLNLNNQTQANYPFNKTLQVLFEENVQANGTGEAVRFGQTSITYNQLNAKSNRVANYLRQEWQIEGNDLVGILTERSIDMISGVLSIIKSGAGYLPIDPIYPEERIRYMLQDSNVRVVLTDNEFWLKQVIPSCQFIDIRQGDSWNSYSENNPATTNDPESLAYVIYTSGSTGNPKGVMIQHRSAVNYIIWANSYYFNNASAYSFGLFTSLSFDLTVTSIFSSLLRGASLKVYEEIEITEILRDMFSPENSINAVKLTPSHIDLLGECEILNSNIEIAIVGGEALKNSHVKILRRLNPDIRIYNEYGPTEATVGCTVKEIQLLDEQITIGKPISNMQILVLNENLFLSPENVYGEICISGVGLAKGYIHNEKLTNTKFVKHPFIKAEKIYRTGDIGRWLSNGEIEYLGRKDDQVKLNGYRIELGEIESNLLTHEAVDYAVATIVENEGNKSIASYVVSKVSIATLDLKKYLAQYLPEYMIPGFIIQIESIPVTQNGKLDRAKLPIPGIDHATNELVLPSNTVEERLLEIWKNILKIDTISVKDNFFEIGGHSLKAMSLIAKINKQFSIKLKLRVAQDHPTIEQLANAILSSQVISSPQIVNVEICDNYPLSASQKRLWILSQLEGSSAAYNIPGGFILEGFLNKDAFEKAFQSLIERHESLRTVFVFIDGEPRQAVLQDRTLHLALQEIDLRENVEIEKRVKQLSALESNQVFDLENGPLLRGKLIRTSDTKHVFLFTMHHIISDGWSMGVLFRDLMKLYNSYSKGENNPLAALRLQYKDYAVWHNRQIQEELAGHKQYWLDKLSGDITPIDLSLYKSRPSIQTYNGSILNYELPEILSTQIKGLSQSLNVSLFTALVAGLNILCYKYTGIKDILLGTSVAGRTNAELEDQIGIYLNTVVLRTIIIAERSYQDFVKECKENVLESFEHQIYPFDQIVEELKLPRDLSRNPLFDVLVELQNFDSISIQDHLEGISIHGLETENKTSICDLNFAFFETGNKIGLALRYNSDVFYKEEIDSMYRRLVWLFEQITANPADSIQHYTLSLPEEKRLLEEFNNANRFFDRSKSILELIELQEEINGSSIALKDKNKEYSYSSLLQHSRTVADEMLKQVKIEEDDLVLILMTRSALFPISIMGVWETGAAYVPVDPDFPEDRIRSIIADCKPKIVLTERNIFDAYEKGMELNMPVLCIDDICHNNFSDRKLPLRKIDTNTLAYVIYTSGSTGVPKGAMVEHVGMQNHMWAKINDLGLNKESIVAQNASQCFDISVWQFFSAMVMGGTTIVYEDEMVLNPEDFITKIDQDKVTVLEVVPTYLSVVLSVLEQKKRTDFLKSLLYLMVTGEVVKKSLVVEWFRLFNTIPMVNAYGPTEASDDITHYFMDNVPDLDTIPIGKPVQNFNIYIVNEDEQLCPIGIKGQIWVSGIGVGRGYLNDKIKTEKVFMEDPFRKESGFRLYKTGDVGRWLADGTIEFYGRVDHQVKIRGHRIELGEIESKLTKQEGIKDAVVQDYEDSTGIKYLVGYLMVYPDTNKETIVEIVRGQLAKEVPDYMIPAYILVVDQLPLTSNGKIDRKKLPIPDGSVIETIKYVAARNEIELELVAIWKTVLERERIGVMDNFFEIGGHSLKAMRVISSIQNTMQVKIGLNDFFINPTIESLALNIEAIKWSISNTSIDNDEIEEILI